MRPEPGLAAPLGSRQNAPAPNTAGNAVRQSMGRKGNCRDNSPTERVFRSLKYEQLNYERFETRGQAKLSVIDYLAFYNGRRSHSKLRYKTPLEFERDYHSKAA